MKQASLENIPPLLKEAYNKVSSDRGGLQVMFSKDANRMVNFIDIPEENIQPTKAPALIIVGDKDIITVEHAIEMSRLIPNSELAIIQGGHGEYIGEITTLQSGSNESDFVVPMIKRFLDQKGK
jgi:pimeloyl-ACP methyl ester carboxylesterase